MMTSNHSISPPLLPTTRSSMISKSVSITSAKTSSSDLYNISYLLKRIRGQRSSKNTSWLSARDIQQQPNRHRTIINDHKPSLNNPIALINTQQQTFINTPIHRRNQTSLFHRDRLKPKGRMLVSDPLNKKFRGIRPKQYKNYSRQETQQFNNGAYCLAYCTIIIIGVTIGGWLGGLFELIFGGLNGCNNEYRGHIKCQIKYASLNVTTHCVNIFYTNSTRKNPPFLCLCRFRNNSKGKYRDCEFLHAKIRYI